MNYQEWNKCLVEYFFCDANKDANKKKTIRFFMADGYVLSLASKQPYSAALIADFIVACAEECKDEEGIVNIRKYMSDARKNTSTRNDTANKYVAFLCFLSLAWQFDLSDPNATAETRNTNYYPRLAKNISWAYNEMDADCDQTASSDSDCDDNAANGNASPVFCKDNVGLWDNVKKFYEKKDFMFCTDSIGSDSFVGKAWAHAIFKSEQISDIHTQWRQAGYTPGNKPTDEKFQQQAETICEESHWDTVESAEIESALRLLFDAWDGSADNDLKLFWGFSSASEVHLYKRKDQQLSEVVEISEGAKFIEIDQKSYKIPDPPIKIDNQYTLWIKQNGKLKPQLGQFLTRNKLYILGGCPNILGGCPTVKIEEEEVQGTRQGGTLYCFDFRGKIQIYNTPVFINGKEVLKTGARSIVFYGIRYMDITVEGNHYPIFEHLAEDSSTYTICCTDRDNSGDWSCSDGLLINQNMITIPRTMYNKKLWVKKGRIKQYFLIAFQDKWKNITSAEVPCKDIGIEKYQYDGLTFLKAADGLVWGWRKSMENTCQLEELEFTKGMAEEYYLVVVFSNQTEIPQCVFDEQTIDIPFSSERISEKSLKDILTKEICRKHFGKKLPLQFGNEEIATITCLPDCPLVFKQGEDYFFYPGPNQDGKLYVVCDSETINIPEEYREFEAVEVEGISCKKILALPQPQSPFGLRLFACKNGSSIEYFSDRMEITQTQGFQQEILIANCLKFNLGATAQRYQTIYPEMYYQLQEIPLEERIKNDLSNSDTNFLLCEEDSPLFNLTEGLSQEKLDFLSSLKQLALIRNYERSRKVITGLGDLFLPKDVREEEKRNSIGLSYQIVGDDTPYPFNSSKDNILEPPNQYTFGDAMNRHGGKVRCKNGNHQEIRLQIKSENDQTDFCDYIVDRENVESDFYFNQSIIKDFNICITIAGNISPILGLVLKAYSVKSVTLCRKAVVFAAIFARLIATHPQLRQTVFGQFVSEISVAIWESGNESLLKQFSADLLGTEFFLTWGSKAI